MACYEFKSLLPDNATELELSLEQTLRQKYCAADITLIQALSDPWQCPLEFLPWLAFAESVDVWNDRWPEETKRAVIANAKTLHRRKGTTGGVRDALAALGVNMSIVSWHDKDPEGAVGTASFELWVNDNINPDAAVMMDALMIRDIIQTIERNKRLSVHYTLTLGIELTAKLRVGLSAQIASQFNLIADHIRSYVNVGMAQIARAFSVQITTITHIKASAE